MRHPNICKLSYENMPGMAQENTLDERCPAGSILDFYGLHDASMVRVPALRLGEGFRAVEAS
jgi:hypothetical protein